jgi:glycosyltransferase involved in cell wall biosynthesis
MVKISIITVTFNRGYIIRDAIESVLRQKYKNYEYIIVDGASKDNTVEILKEFEPKFEGRMRWISEPDKGLYDAINKGIKMATGDVVGIINSDDFFHRDDTFEKIAQAFSDKTIEAVYADERDVKVGKEDKNSRYCSANFFKPWMFRIGLMPAHSSFYAKRLLFEKYGYYKIDYKIAADLELMIRFIYVHKIILLL